jgi:hypothetical protein
VSKVSNRKGHSVICNQTGEIFISVLEAEHKTGIYRTAIYRQLTGKIKKTKCPLTFRYTDVGGAQFQR